MSIRHTSSFTTYPFHCRMYWVNCRDVHNKYWLVCSCLMKYTMDNMDNGSFTITKTIFHNNLFISLSYVNMESLNGKRDLFGETKFVPTLKYFITKTQFLEDPSTFTNHKSITRHQVLCWFLIKPSLRWSVYRLIHSLIGCLSQDKLLAYQYNTFSGYPQINPTK